MWMCVKSIHPSGDDTEYVHGEKYLQIKRREKKIVARFGYTFFINNSRKFRIRAIWAHFKKKIGGKKRLIVQTPLGRRHKKKKGKTFIRLTKSNFSIIRLTK